MLSLCSPCVVLDDVLVLWYAVPLPSQVAGDARTMRRQMRDRALAGLDKLEVLQRSAMSGGPMTAPSLAGDLPAPSEAGAAGAEDESQYQPTKVRHTRQRSQQMQRQSSHGRTI